LMLQVYTEMQRIEKEDLINYYNANIVSFGEETRALVITCTSRRHAEVFELDLEDQWIILDPIAARNSMMVAPWSISNTVHNLKVSLGMSGTACAGLGSCTCVD
jgi:acyl dehydratase